jgi:hypothetical protein
MMEELLLELLNRLQEIESDHNEICDTACRSAMASAVFNTSLSPKDGYRFPHDFGLTEPHGNQAVREALKRYASAARELAPTVGVRTFQQRLAAFQDSSVCTEDGATYDDFFGSYSVAMCTEDGEWLG